MKETLLHKISNHHLSRSAYLYVRQSTLKQVCENTESTRRQYALSDRAASLGWSKEQIIVIDDDLGQSGASAADRRGFQQLVSEVSLGKAGVVIGLEVSRLARNNADWHRLLEICALSNTLILDEDGLYNPSDFNDRLVLGMKGTFSEAELHILRARLRGGVLNKARRGELRLALPTGLVYDPEGTVVLDPDEQVKQSIRYLFETFHRTHSASATVGVFRDESLLFPSRLRTGARKGQLEWVPLIHSRVLRVLHNPRYAGTFFYGKREYKRLPTGWHGVRQRPMDEWVSCVMDCHEGYISWEQFLHNQRILASNALGHAKGERNGGPPREGPALLQGLVRCGVCGRHMTLRYHERKGRSVPDYVCQRARIEYNEPVCQSVPGANLDDTISALVQEVVSRQTIDITLLVQQEVNARAQEVETLRRKRLERARHEAEMARERYLYVDPRNRLVADSLERSWNEKLRFLHELEEQYEQSARQSIDANDSDLQRKLTELIKNFSRIWHEPSISNADRKRIVRLVIEDVTLIKDKQKGDIHAHIRFKGGATRSVKLAIPVIIYEKWKTKPHIIKEIDQLLDEHTESQIAHLLTERGIRTSHGNRFRTENVAYLRREHGLRHRKLRLRDRGFLTLRETAHALGVPMKEVKQRAERGEIETCAADSRSKRLYKAFAIEGKRRSNPNSDPDERVSKHEVQYA